MIRARIPIMLITAFLESVASAQQPQEQSDAYKAKAMLLRVSVAVKADRDSALKATYRRCHELGRPASEVSFAARLRRRRTGPPAARAAVSVENLAKDASATVPSLRRITYRKRPLASATVVRRSGRSV